MYSKITIILGHNADRSALDKLPIGDERNNWLLKHSISTHRNGFWKPETAAKVAKKLGMVGEVKVLHESRYDTRAAWKVNNEFKITV